MSFVSIIIPNYNGSKHLLKTINACIEQEEFIKEIIVVDDHSTDDSWNILQEIKFCGRLRIFRNPGKGANDARNYGYCQSTGLFIQWLDADDELLPGKLKTQIKFLEHHPDIDIVYSDWQLDTYFDDLLLNSEFKKCKQSNNFLHQLLIDNWNPMHSYLMRRTTADAGIWNPETKVSQDREYFTNCALRGAKFGYVKGNFCIYNRFKQEASVSRAMKPKQRAEHILKLLYSFSENIANQPWIINSDRRKYRNLLTTQILYFSALYNLPMQQSVSLLSIKWLLVKGWRSRLKVLKRVLLDRLLLIFN